MIDIIKRDRQQLIIKRYPAKMWLAFIFLFILLIGLDYYTLFYLPVYSSLTCTKGFLNNNTCTLAESSSLNKNFTYRNVHNIHHAEHRIRTKSIFLKAEFHLKGNIENIYFPTRSWTRPNLYHTNGELQIDIKKINDFIHNRNEQSLEIKKGMPSSTRTLPLFLIPLIPSLLPLIIIVIFPITTYSFKSLTNKLTIKEFIPLSRKETINFEELEDVELITNSKSIVLKVKDKEIVNFNNFTSKEEYLKVLELIKQYIPAIAKENIGTWNNTSISS